MCGIAGFCDFGKKADLDDLKRMTDVLWYRGPDSSGYVFQRLENANVGLGHRRLSIIDLSEKAAQPLKDESGNYQIIFNGEIYNYHEIRNELEKEGCAFFSASDTEVLLKAFIRWGGDAIHRCIGMFAFVIFDKRESKLYLFRDRAGVKPLHYYYKGGIFMFSSEIKSFHQLSAFKKSISIEALSLYFKFGYTPSPYTIFENAYKVKPGHYMVLDIKSGKLEERKYWDVYDYYNMPPLNIGESEAVEEMERLLLSAFQYRMVADVPVGVFLSSGYDSTAVTALLQANMSDKLKTFTIGFKEQRFNEAVDAKAIAQHIGTDHTEYYCTETEGKELIKTLPHFYDEPFSDPSAIPTMLVSKMARKKVTVALSADGGDETFAGYDHTQRYVDSYRRSVSVPRLLKGIFSKSADLLSHMTISYAGYNKYLMIFINQLWKLRDRMSISEVIDIIAQGRTTNYRIYRLLKAVPDLCGTDLSEEMNLSAGVDVLNQCLAIDYRNYMVDDILTKVDRATMSVSLEGREPLLDHRIIEFAARLPLAYKYDNGTRKKILKNIVHKYVAESLMARPKKGFGVPVKRWLRNDLSYLVTHYLDDKQLNKHGLFNPEYVAYIKNKYIKDGSEFNMVWLVLVFQMWYQMWMCNEEPRLG